MTQDTYLDLNTEDLFDLGAASDATQGLPGDPEEFDIDRRRPL